MKKIEELYAAFVVLVWYKLFPPKPLPIKVRTKTEIYKLMNGDWRHSDD